MPRLVGEPFYLLIVLVPWLFAAWSGKLLLALVTILELRQNRRAQTQHRARYRLFVLATKAVLLTLLIETLWFLQLNPHTQFGWQDFIGTAVHDSDVYFALFAAAYFFSLVYIGLHGLIQSQVQHQLL